MNSVAQILGTTWLKEQEANFKVLEDYKTRNLETHAEIKELLSKTDEELEAGAVNIKRGASNRGFF